MRELINIVEAAAVVTYTAYRYHNELNRFSTEFRLGTWYAASASAAKRYNNANLDLKLGGTILTTGTIASHNPFFIQVGSSGVLFDAWRDLPFGERITDLVFAKTRGEIARAATPLVSDATLLKAILALREFNAKTVITERVAALWCQANGYDLIVLGNQNDPRELFDFEELFRSA